MAAAGVFRPHDMQMSYRVGTSAHPTENGRVGTCAHADLYSRIIVQ